LLKRLMLKYYPLRVKLLIVQLGNRNIIEHTKIQIMLLCLYP
jgi:hypothetical protein